MGHLRAIELASGEFGLTIEQAISLHLTSNHDHPRRPRWCSPALMPSLPATEVIGMQRLT